MLSLLLENNRNSKDKIISIHTALENSKELLKEKNVNIENLLSRLE
jgi:hypothetical protein